MCAGMAVSPDLETVQNNNEKIWAMSNVLKKLSIVVALLLTSNRKNELGEKVDDF